MQSDGEINAYKFLFLNNYERSLFWTVNRKMRNTTKKDFEVIFSSRGKIWPGDIAHAFLCTIDLGCFALETKFDCSSVDRLLCLSLCNVEHVRSRSQWPRSLRNELSSLVRTLRSGNRIPLKAWMSVCVYSVCR
jgi:hypothetical protein